MIEQESAVKLGVDCIASLIGGPNQEPGHRLSRYQGKWTSPAP
jgi:hypothetical protein